MSSSGQKYGKAPDRSSFVNLLSQYLKEKRNLGDISVGASGRLGVKGLETPRNTPAMTMNLLPNMANSGEDLRETAMVASTSNVKSSDFFPELAGVGGPSPVEDTTNKTAKRTPAAVEPKAAQMTIFYAGQVVVFNNFPADKAEEIMALASQKCSSSIGHFVSDSNLDNSKSSNSEIPDLNMATTTGLTPTQEPCIERNPDVGSDVQMPRRNSLLKFFEKRKDRVAARAPYQVNNRRELPPPPKPDETNTSREEGQSSHEASKDLDLRL